MARFSDRRFLLGESTLHFIGKRGFFLGETMTACAASAASFFGSDALNLGSVRRFFFCQARTLGRNG